MYKAISPTPCFIQLLITRFKILVEHTLKKDIHSYTFTKMHVPINKDTRDIPRANIQIYNTRDKMEEKIQYYK